MYVQYSEYMKNHFCVQRYVQARVVMQVICVHIYLCINKSVLVILSK
jgi:hypothetical protein